MHRLASGGLGFLFSPGADCAPRHAARQLPAGETYVSIGFKQLRKTFSEVKHFPETLKFLLAYFLYNDGIQTVIAVASTFAAAPLIQGGLELETIHFDRRYFDDPIRGLLRSIVLGQTCKLDRRKAIGDCQSC